jgi:hypothetical protein
MLKRHLLIAVSLISFFISIYSLSFSGRPISVDEQLYLTVTRNIAVLDEISAEQLSGSTRLQGSYHGVEPAHPALASLWYDIFSSSQFITWQVLYLLPIFYTVLSCLILYFIAISLGYDPNTGILLSILYGLSTMAFPYAKTFFRELLIIPLMLGSWLSFLNFNHPKKRIRYLAYLSFPILSALLLLTKIPFIVVPITFFFIWLSNIKKEGKDILYKKTIKTTFFFILFLIIFLLSTLSFTDQNIFYRFSGALLKDAINIILFAPHTHFFEVILGSLFSPLKGMIFYSPIILLGVYTMATSWKKNKELFVLPLIVLVILLLNQALAHDAGWWTTPWGNRFLLPVISLFLVASLPVLNRIIRLGKKGYFILGAFFLIGLLIQLPAVLFNSSRFAAYTYANSSTSFLENLWSFSASPILKQWSMASIPLYDLMIWRTFSSEPLLTFFFIAIALVLFLLSLYWLFSKQSFDKPWAPFITSTSLSLLLFGTLLNTGVSDPVYGVKDYQPLCIYIQENLEGDDMLIVDSYPQPIWYFLSAYECGQDVWYSLPYEYAKDTTSLSYERAHNLLFDELNYGGARIWFISQSDDYSMSALGDEAMIENNYRLVGEKYYYSPINTYLFLYETPPFKK